MDIYAPLAERVGMYEYMREMQLLAFEQLEPEAYATLERRLEELRSKDGGQVDAIALKIKQALAESGLKVEVRSEEHTSELQSLMRISYAVFCLKNKNRQHT